jgi:hypothetical protein
LDDGGGAREPPPVRSPNELLRTTKVIPLLIKLM